MEIQVHANMILAYLFSRFGDTGDGLESEASTYSLPAPEYPVSLPTEELPPNYAFKPGIPATAAMSGFGGRGDGYREDRGIGGDEFFDNDGDGSSMASSHTFEEADEARDMPRGYNGSMEYTYTNNNNGAQTLDTSKKQAPLPVRKPNYMGGTSTNKGKRFSTISPQGRGGYGRGISSPGNNVASIRAQKANEMKEDNFKYYAYKRPSVLDHELPVYNKRA